MRLTLRIANVTEDDIARVAEAMWADGIGRVLTNDTDAMYQPSVPDIGFMISRWIDDSGTLDIDCEGPDDLAYPSREEPLCPNLADAVGTIGDRVVRFGVDAGQEPSLAGPGDAARHRDEQEAMAAPGALPY